MNVYEVSIKKDTNLLDYFENLKSLGEFCKYQNVIYLYTDKLKGEIKNQLPFINKIHEIHLNDCESINSDICKEFCLNSLSIEMKRDFEKNNQNQLIALNNKLDYLLELKDNGKLNQFIKDIMNSQNKKAGETIAEGKTS